MAGTTMTPPADERVRLLERDEELGRIDAAVRRAGARKGGLLVVEGAAGIGKTTLLRAARDRAGAAGATVLSARGREMEQRHPFGVVLELLQPADGDALPLDGLLGETPAAPPHEFMVMRAVYRAVAALARDRPVVLLVDDAQWADEQSLVSLLYVAERLDRLAGAVIVAVRMGARATPAPLIDRMRAAGPVLRPDPLTAEATRVLLAAGAPALAEDGAFVRAIHEVTGGNPFLLTELLARRVPLRRGEGVAADVLNARHVGRHKAH